MRQHGALDSMGITAEGITADKKSGATGLVGTDTYGISEVDFLLHDASNGLLLVVENQGSFDDTAGLPRPIQPSK